GRHVWILGLLGLVGTLGVGGSLVWNLDRLDEATLARALASARSSLREDDLYRRWNADHGGVYVELTEAERARDDVFEAGQEVVLEDGRRLDLVHHIGMTRLVHEGPGGRRLEFHGHVTSLNPTEQRNAPDPWERDALERVATGEVEVAGIAPYEGGASLRVMRPLRAESHCLLCHGSQGYRTGDLRGGVVFSVPLDTLPTGALRRDLILAHAGIWVLWLGGLAAGWFALARVEDRRRQAESGRRRALEALGERGRALARKGAALAARTRTLDALIGAIPEAVFFLDPGGRIVLANQAAHVAAGGPETSLDGRLFADVAGALLDPDLGRWAAEACRDPEDFKDARERPCGRTHLATIAAVSGAEGRPLGVLIVLQDLSRLHSLEEERKELGDQLAQQEKLAIVGILAANLARELDGPLGAIALQVRELGAGAAERAVPAALERIEEAVHMCRDTVRRLLEFAQGAPQRPVLCDPAMPLRRALDLALPRLGTRGIEVRLKIDEGTPHVLVDPLRLEQVVHNLLSNAADAMPEGGEIEVRAQTAGAEVSISVSDRGPGIPPRHRAKVFEPFFTTKPSGRGTGLGLAICRRIVEEQRGRIEILDRPGGGTCVRLAFPIPR
ncbi:MAG: ATP-binding protein, partial [Planctomycetota bacterium]